MTALETITALEADLTTRWKDEAKLWGLYLKALGTSLEAYRLGQWQKKRAQITEADAALLTARDALIAAQKEALAAPPIVTAPISETPAGIQIADRAALDKALAGSIDGETLLLADGADFGTLTIKGEIFETGVTISGGRFSGALNLRGVQGLAIYGAEVASIYVADGWGKQGEIDPERIALRGIRAAGQIQLYGLTDFDVEACRSEGGQFGITMIDCVNGRVTGNEVRGFTDDAYRITGGSQRILFEDNLAHLPNAHRSGVHSDCLQMFGRGNRFEGTGRTPSDITIRHNIFRGQPHPRDRSQILTQGILLCNANTDHGFRNILIEENVFDVGAVHSIYVEGAQESVVVRRNTCLPARSGLQSTLSIYTYGEGHSREYDNRGLKMEHNIACAVYNMTPATAVPGENFLFRKAEGFFPEPTGTLTDFLPLDGAGIPEGFGATSWIREKLAA